MILKTNKFFLIFMSLFLLVSCNKIFDPKQFGPIKMEYPTRSDKDIKAPKVLISEIEKNYLKHYKSLHPEDDINEVKVLSSIPRKFFGFDVYFRPTSNKLALYETKKIPFTHGGGYIDLANVIEGPAGSFYLNILFDWKELNLEPEDISGLKVYFLSNSKRRILDGEEWGSGCEKLLEITQFFKSRLMKKGLLLNAKDQRYLSTLAGTFYFVLLKEGDLYLATATFEDTRHKEYMCKV